MALPIRFEQDPGLPQGGGNFFLDNGASYVGYDPGLAGQLTVPPAPEPLAANDAAAQLPPGVGAALAGGARPAPTPIASDATGPLIPPGATLSFGAPPMAPALGTNDRIAAAAGPAFAPPAPPATGGGPVAEAQPQTSPQDVVTAVQGLMGAGTPGTSSFGRTTTVTPGIPFTAEQRQAIDARQQKFSDAVDKIAATQEDRYAEQLGDLRARRSALAMQQEQQQAEVDAKRSIVQQRTADVDAAVKAVMDDRAPKPFGGNVFAQLLATVGQALGAYGASITKTDNWAAKLINEHLAREMQAWQAEQMKKRFGVETAQKLSADARMDLRDASTDRELTQRQLWDVELKQLGAGIEQGDKQDRLQLLRLDNQDRMDALRTQMEREAQDRIQVSTHAQSSGGTPGRPATRLEAAVKAREMGVISPDEQRQVLRQGESPEAAEKREPLKVTLSNGAEIQAKTKEAADQLRTLTAEVDSGSKAIESMRKLTGLVNPGRLAPWTTDAERQWDTYKLGLMHAFNNITTAKDTALREGFAHLIDKALPEKPWNANADSALDAIKKQFNDVLDARVRAQLK